MDLAQTRRDGMRRWRDESTDDRCGENGRRFGQHRIALVDGKLHLGESLAEAGQNLGKQTEEDRLRQALDESPFAEIADIPMKA